MFNFIVMVVVFLAGAFVQAKFNFVPVAFVAKVSEVFHNLVAKIFHK